MMRSFIIIQLGGSKESGTETWCLWSKLSRRGLWEGTEHTSWAVKLLPKDVRLGVYVCQNDGIVRRPVKLTMCKYTIKKKANCNLNHMIKVISLITEQSDIMLLLI